MFVIPLLFVNCCNRGVGSDKTMPLSLLLCLDVAFSLFAFHIYPSHCADLSLVRVTSELIFLPLESLSVPVIINIPVSPSS